jgi:hypothetical protein
MDIIDDVEIGENISAGIENDSGAHPVHTLRLDRLAEWVIGGGSYSAFAVDVHNRSLDPLVNIDHLILTLAWGNLAIGSEAPGGWGLEGGSEGDEPNENRQPGWHKQPPASGQDETDNGLRTHVAPVPAADSIPERHN